MIEISERDIVSLFADFIDCIKLAEELTPVNLEDRAQRIITVARSALDTIEKAAPNMEALYDKFGP